MKRPIRRTSGFTLIELLVALAMGTALMGTLAAVVSRVLVANAAAGEHLEGIVALGRLGEQFRSDVHAASAANLEKESGQIRRLRLEGPDGERVEYEIVETGLRRAASRSGEVKSREMFVLAGMKVLGWNEDFQTTGAVSLLVGRLARRGDDNAAIRNQFSVAASLGRDQRLKGSP
jgi:prepilin-type N-terminal cleavage/methylation domain-containing protein